MKSSLAKLFALFALSGLLSAPSLSAQPGPRAGGGGPGSQFSRMYNPQSVETITGEVMTVEQVTPAQGMGHGVHLQVRTDKETLPVHLGPAWFIDNQELQIKPKDQVQITGSRVTLEGKPVLIASEVKDGDAVLKLRDEQGIPVWAGWRQGGAGAASAPGGMMRGPGGMGTNVMARHREMLQEHQKMMTEMKAMDADLDQKVAQMNQAQGQAKVDAMAAVINDLVKERQMMHQHMTEMHQHMMSHMQSMSGAGNGSGPDASSGTSGGSSSPGSQ